MRNTSTSRRPGRHATRRGFGGTGASQRGAAAIFAAVGVIALLISLLLAVNIGLLYYAQRDLQKQASLAAIAAARATSGCGNTNGVPGSLTAVTAAAQAALAANAVGNTTGAAQLASIGGAPAVQFGHMVPSGGLNKFTALAAGDPQIDSVQVNVSMASPAILGGGLLSGAASQTLYASATARQKLSGYFDLTSTVATLNNGIVNALLSGLLHTNVSLSVSSLNNLVSSKISLGQLEVAAGVNNLNDLLAINTSLPGALQILGGALSSGSDAASQAAGGLVSGLAGQSFTGAGNVNFGDLFNQLGSQLNLPVSDVLSSVPVVDGLSLLEALGEDASKNQPIALPVSVSIPGVANLGVFATIGTPAVVPVPGPVGSTGSTAQITLNTRLSLNSSLLSGLLGTLNSILGLLGSGATVQLPINLGLDLKVAAASGTLTSLSCPTGSNVSPSASVGVTANVAKLTLGTFSGTGPFTASTVPAVTGGPFLAIKAQLLLIPLGNIINVSFNNNVPVDVGTALNSTAGPFTQYLAPTLAGTGDNHTQEYIAIGSPTLDPPATASNPQTVGSGNLTSSVSSAVTQLLSYPGGNLNITVANISLTPILSPLLSALSSLVLTPLTTLLDSVITPLLQALGVQLAGATISMNSVVTGQPVIVSTCLPGATGGGCAP